MKRFCWSRPSCGVVVCPWAAVNCHVLGGTMPGLYGDVSHQQNVYSHCHCQAKQPLDLLFPS